MESDMERHARRKEKEWLGRKARLQYKPLQVRALEERDLDVRKDFDHKVYIAIRVHADSPCWPGPKSHWVQSSNWNIRVVLCSVSANASWQK